MATSAIDGLMRGLHRAAVMQEGAGMTDGQLLGGFIERRDEAAFEILVRRHGPMVLGVCRRVLRNTPDAEDAFQATFLVLARKAPSIRPREHVVRWLYGVAYRTARKARAMTVKRSLKERRMAEATEPEASAPDPREELEPLLDQELNGLPEHYRLPIVLCDLEGKTRPEAARLLGCPEGTVSSRLTRARAMLAKRLARRGFAAPGAVLLAALSPRGGLPVALAASTARAACLFTAKTAAAGVVSAKVATLAEGVLKAMLLSKLKLTLLVLLAVGVLGAGLTAGFLAAGAKAAGPAPAARAAADAKSDKEKLQGEWLQLSAEGKFGKVPDEILKREVMVVADDTITMKSKDGKGGEYELTFKFDESTDPKSVDDFLVKPEKKDKPYLGIYSLDGDTVKFCFSDPGEKRPTEFSGKLGAGWTLTVFKRKPKE